MAVIITRPLDKVTGVSVSAIAGAGYLPAGTYYVHIYATQLAIPTNNSTANIQLVPSGPISDIVSVTASVSSALDITWNPVTGSHGYVIYLSDNGTRWHFNNQKTYGCLGPNDQYVSSRISASGQSTSAYRWSGSAFTIGDYSLMPLYYAVPPNDGLEYNLGRVIISVSGNETWDSIYNSITAAGLSAYMTKTNSTYALYGSLSAFGTGSLCASQKSIHIQNGTLINASSNFNMVFGSKDTSKNMVYNGCAISTHGAIDTTNMKMYGCYIDYFLAPAIGVGAGFATMTMTPPGVGGNGELLGNSFGQLRVVINNSYGLTGGALQLMGSDYLNPRYSELYKVEFYKCWFFIMHQNISVVRECKFTTSQAYHFALTNSADYTIFPYYIVDCEFLDTTDNLPLLNFSSAAANPKKYIHVQNSMSINVTDENNSPIQGARVVISNDGGIWANKNTDANGSIPRVDVTHHRMSHKYNAGAGTGPTYTTIDDWSTVTITIQKQGYKTYES